MSMLTRADHNVSSAAIMHVYCAGMTNRPDLIDDALMRPGRFEVKMEIGEYNTTAFFLFTISL